MRKTITIILALAVLFVGIPSVFSAGAQETSEDTFLNRFETELENSNYSEEEVEAIIASANNYSWEDAEEVDAAAVLQGLNIAREEQVNLDADDTAELALALAQNAARLEDEDYDENAVSQAVRETVRNQLQIIQEWKDSDRSESLGELIRSGVNNEARKAAQELESGETDDDADDMYDTDDMDDVDDTDDMDDVDDADDMYDTDDMDDMDDVDDTDDMYDTDDDDDDDDDDEEEKDDDDDDDADDTNQY